MDRTVSTFSAGNYGGSYTLFVDDWDTNAYYTIDRRLTAMGMVWRYHNGRMASCMAVSNFLSSCVVTNVTSLGAFSRTETVYFTPIDVNYSTVTVTGSEAGRLTPVKLLVEGNYLGSDNFQTVIASSNSVKEELENSDSGRTLERSHPATGTLPIMVFWMTMERSYAVRSPENIPSSSTHAASATGRAAAWKAFWRPCGRAML